MQIDTIILGAGAAGMMCAAHTGGRVLLIDHSKAPGEKIRISGGGRCNFTNLNCGPHAFLGENAHFHKSALSRYTQWDFVDVVDRFGISWHEKTLGQLFCDTSAKDIIAMLRTLMERAGVALQLKTTIHEVAKSDGGFEVALETDGQPWTANASSLVIATGGKSIPKMGATGFAYDIARQFGHRVTDTRAALVPFTFPEKRFAALAGVSVPSMVTTRGTMFEESMLFTHRGLSGPAILQVSSYWEEGSPISVNLTPGADLGATLREKRKGEGKRHLRTELGHHLPGRLVDYLAGQLDLRGNLGDLSDRRIETLSDGLANWALTPSGTEGYRTAEVTLGGVATDGLSSTTMMSRRVNGLYFIGEAVDVTGWLGGYNFQWAWSSAMAAARAIAADQSRA
ncbi:MAG: aminoacetone oxidase family FAD-binding enzyme [Pseudomonadota bacterium]